MLQSQDMSKIGFNQDLLYGIKKVLSGDKASSAKPAAAASAGSEVEPLIKRIRIFLKTEDFSLASEYCDKVLDKDPENAEVYLLLLMAEKRLKSEEELCSLDEKLESLKNFQLAMDFADAPVKARLQAHVKKQKDEWRYKELVGQFQKLDKNNASLGTYNELRRLAVKFEALGNYRDSETLKNQCEEHAAAIKQQKQDEYSQLLESVTFLKERESLPEDWEALANMFRKCSDFVPEAEEKARQCVESARSLTYSKAMELKKAKEFDKAIEVFSALDGYADSSEQIIQCQQEIHEEEKRRQRRILRRIGIIVLCAAAIAITLFAVGRKKEINRLKMEAQAACEQGDWQRVESLGTELFKLSDKEAKAFLARAKECHINQLKKEADMAYEQGNWQMLESLGKKLEQVSPKEGAAVLARVNECHIKHLKKEADTAYEQGNWQRLESLGKKLEELSTEEGATILGRSKELRKVVEEEIRTGLRPYMTVNLQSWTVRYSTTPPVFSDDACRTTELWLRWIPAGTFTMGSPGYERGRYYREVQHEVTLTSGYWIGIFEVTQKQWSLIMGSDSSFLFLGETRPMMLVSYNDIRGERKGAGWPTGGHEVDSGSFLGKLRMKTWFAFDLPTEAQWEYACRAGTTTALNSGKNLTAEKECPNMAVVGRYKGSDGKEGDGLFTKVGSYQPNPWGLYDMHGNVWEWCLDWYGDYPSSAVTDQQGAVSGSYRVLRGGGCDDYALFCRSAYRNYLASSDRHSDIGFRVVLVP